VVQEVFFTPKGYFALKPPSGRLRIYFQAWTLTAIPTTRDEKLNVDALIGFRKAHRCTRCTPMHTDRLWVCF